MPRVILESSIPKNSNLPITVSRLKSQYFLGIPIVAPDGNLMSDEDIATFIQGAIAELETELDIRIPLQVVQENMQFLFEEYQDWSYIKTSYPVVCVKSVEGFIGTTRQVTYPQSWFSIQKSTDGIRHRRFSIVPNSSDNNLIDQSIVYAGIYPQLGYYGNRNIPDYWTITYTTGFSKVPEDLVKIIAMKASIPIFDQLGDLIAGAGVASYSLGLDGLSSSLSTTSSATNSGYGARITSYQKTIKDTLPALKKKYSGFIFSAV